MILITSYKLYLQTQPHWQAGLQATDLEGTQFSPQLLCHLLRGEDWGKKHLPLSLARTFRFSNNTTLTKATDGPDHNEGLRTRITAAWIYSIFLHQELCSDFLSLISFDLIIFILQMAEWKYREVTYTRSHSWQAVNQERSDVRTHTLFSFNAMEKL